MLQEKPMFMQNDEWYAINEDPETMDERGYVLTDKAPEEAVKSYEEFYSDEEGEEER